jgi:hypothetical protein
MLRAFASWYALDVGGGQLAALDMGQHVWRLLAWLISCLWRWWQWTDLVCRFQMQHPMGSEREACHEAGHIVIGHPTGMDGVPDSACGCGWLNHAGARAGAAGDRYRVGSDCRRETHGECAGPLTAATAGRRR